MPEIPTTSDGVGLPLAASCCWVTSAPVRVYLVDTHMRFDQATDCTDTLNITDVGAAGQ